MAAYRAGSWSPEPWCATVVTSARTPAAPTVARSRRWTSEPMSPTASRTRVPVSSRSTSPASLTSWEPPSAAPGGPVSSTSTRTGPTSREVPASGRSSTAPCSPAHAATAASTSSGMPPGADQTRATGPVAATPARPPTWSACRWVRATSGTSVTPARSRQPCTAVGSGPVSTTTALVGPARTSRLSPWPTSHTTTAQPAPGHGSGRPGRGPDRTGDERGDHDEHGRHQRERPQAGDAGPGRGPVGRRPQRRPRRGPGGPGLALRPPVGKQADDDRGGGQGGQRRSRGEDGPSGSLGDGDRGGGQVGGGARDDRDPRGAPPGGGRDQGGRPGVDGRQERREQPEHRRRGDCGGGEHVGRQGVRAERGRQTDEDRRHGRLRRGRDGERRGEGAGQRAPQGAGPRTGEDHDGRRRQHAQAEPGRPGQPRVRDEHDDDGDAQRGRAPAAPAEHHPGQGHRTHDGGPQDARVGPGHHDERDQGGRRQDRGQAAAAPQGHDEQQHTAADEGDVRPRHGRQVRQPGGAHVVDEVVGLQAGVADDQAGQQRRPVTDGRSRPGPHRARDSLRPRRRSSGGLVTGGRLHEAAAQGLGRPPPPARPGQDGRPARGGGQHRPGLSRGGGGQAQHRPAALAPARVRPRRVAADHRRDPDRDLAAVRGADPDDEHPDTDLRPLPRGRPLAGDRVPDHDQLGGDDPAASGGAEHGGVLPALEPGRRDGEDRRGAGPGQHQRGEHVPGTTPGPGPRGRPAVARPPGSSRPVRHGPRGTAPQDARPHRPEQR